MFLCLRFPGTIPGNRLAAPPNAPAASSKVLSVWLPGLRLLSRLRLPLRLLSIQPGLLQLRLRAGILLGRLSAGPRVCPPRLLALVGLRSLDCEVRS